MKSELNSNIQSNSCVCTDVGIVLIALHKVAFLYVHTVTAGTASVAGRGPAAALAITETVGHDQSTYCITRDIVEVALRERTIQTQPPCPPIFGT